MSQAKQILAAAVLAAMTAYPAAAQSAQDTAPDLSAAFSAAQAAVAQPFRTAQADKTATPGLSGQTAKPLPYGWMEALPSIFVIAANNAKGTYPSDGVETETLTLKWFDCAQAAAAAGFAGQPTLCKDHYAVHLIYQWTPNACQGVAGADADCAKARVTKDVSFPLLRADMAAGVVRLPTWPDTPASITDTVIARIEDASSANPRVVLLDGYTLKREKTLDQGDEAYRHCRYDDDGAGWTDCDNKPGVATVVNKVRLEGPGLDPACDTQQEIAHPDVYCSKPK